MSFGSSSARYSDALPSWWTDALASSAAPAGTATPSIRNDPTANSASMTWTSKRPSSNVGGDAHGPAAVTSNTDAIGSKKSDKTGGGGFYGADGRYHHYPNVDKSNGGSGGVVAVVVVVILIILLILLLVWYFLCRRKPKECNDGPKSTCGTKKGDKCGSKQGDVKQAGGGNATSKKVPECRLAEEQYKQSRIVSDIDHTAQITDTNTVNPWGIAFEAPADWSCDAKQCSPTTNVWHNDTKNCTPSTPQLVWIADNGTNVLEQFSVVQNAKAKSLELVTTIAVAGAGAPTGVVYNNSTTSFQITEGKVTAPAKVITVTESGTINGFNALVNPTTAIVVVDSPTKVFKGVAIDATRNQLYVANFSDSLVEIYDSTFALTSTFTDAALSSIGYAPFNVIVACDLVYVAFAQQDDAKHDNVSGQGNGFIDVFQFDGTFVRRLASRGPLDAPWAMSVVNNVLLVGNFGDGTINAFSLDTDNAWVQPLKDRYGNAIAIDSLWGVTRVPVRRTKSKSGCSCSNTCRSKCGSKQCGTSSCTGCSSQSQSSPSACEGAFLYAAGIVDEAHGLVGFLTTI